MIVRSEYLFALSLPVIAVSWVIADTTAELVAANRNVHAAQSVVQFVGAPTTTATFDVDQYRAPAEICASDSAGGVAKDRLRSHGISQAALQRLCRAGLKFTTSLPKT